MSRNVILVYKNNTVTSVKLIKYVSLYLKFLKIGHTGSLDPSAEGLLIVCGDNDVYLIKSLINKKKRYVVIAISGVISNTLDFDGIVLFYSKEAVYSLKILLRNLFDVKKNIQQCVPFFSAVKYNSIPLYKYSRYGVKTRVKNNSIYIYNIKIIKKENNLIILDIICSKGTYVRSIIREIGIYIKIPMIVYKIIRVSIGRLLVLDSYILM